MKKTRKPVTIGRVYKNLSGLSFKVTKLLTDRKVEVKFLESGTVVTTLANNLSAGKVKDPSVPIVNGGITSTAKFTRKEYMLWYNMLYRVTHSPQYTDVTICDRWLILDNFLSDIRKLDNYDEWLTTNNLELDKDIKYKGNRVYSPQACMFVTCKYNKTDGVIRLNEKNIDVYLAEHLDGTQVTFMNQRKFANEYGLCYKNVNRSIKKGGRTKGWIFKKITN